jgi:hypothetical protein
MNSPIVNCRQTSEEIRRVLREAPLVAVREMLTDQDVFDACQECGHTYRDRRYGPVVTVFHFLAQAINREDSFASTWQELFAPLACELPELDLGRADLSGLTHARGRLPVGVMTTLARQACRGTAEVTPPRWRGLTVSALDCSTISLPDEPALHAHFGTPRVKTAGRRKARYPAGTLAVLLQVGTSLIRDWRFGPYDPGELTTASPLIEHLGPGDLLLADRRFAGAPFLAKLETRSCSWLMRKHQRVKVNDLPVIQRLGRDDFISELTVSKSARAKDPTLPAKVRVRVFKATWKAPDGRKFTEWFVTNLLDPRRFKKRAMAKLYHQRWYIETSYLEFKQTLGAAVLRSKTIGNVIKELTAHVLAFQLVHRLMIAAAEKHHKKPNEISFLNAARWVEQFSHQMAAAPAWKLPILFHRLLDCIATTPLDVRPGRLEPRAISRETHRYPWRTLPRHKWRQQQLREVG